MGHFIKFEIGAVSRIDNGGGVWYDSNSNDTATAASQRAVMELTLSGSTISANTADTHGGGFLQPCQQP